ncbi:MAG: hypothetical protein KIT36_12485 [Alphaproteobacteria bacterium]|nr:hypothetical protein [Alphaproteobacteria bacterium]
MSRRSASPHRADRIVGRTVALLLAALALAGLTATAAAHDDHDWIRQGKYRSPLTNEWCCGEDDCVAIPADQMEPTASGWRILPTEEVVPYVDTLPSEDGRFWRCHQPNGVRRCFFAPPGTS